MARPNLVLIGAPKCGTTTLFHWLAAHPAVATGQRKEAQFLVDPGSSIFHPEANHRDHGMAGYEALFPAADVVFDATPGYLYQETALRVLSEDLTDAKLLLVVRDPVERFLSAHRYFTHNQPVLDVGISAEDLLDRCLADDPSLPTNEFVRDAVRHGEYAAHLDRWAAACGRDRIMVQFAEDLRDRPTGVLEEVAAWVGIDPTPLTDQALADHNVSYNVRNQSVQRLAAGIRSAIPKGRLRSALARTYHRLNVTQHRTDGTEAAVRARLAEHYAPFNARLAADLGRELAQWTAVD